MTAVGIPNCISTARQGEEGQFFSTQQQHYDVPIEEGWNFMISKRLAGGD